MTIKVFGQLYDIVGGSSIEIDNASNTNELIKNLQTKYPALVNSKFKVAVNRNIIQSNTIIESNAEIALLPPFSGG
jgi:molybdopterin synthase sulfur carrier subunit